MKNYPSANGDPRESSGVKGPLTRLARIARLTDTQRAGAVDPAAETGLIARAVFSLAFTSRWTERDGGRRLFIGARESEKRTALRKKPRRDRERWRVTNAPKNRACYAEADGARQRERRGDQSEPESAAQERREGWRKNRRSQRSPRHFTSSERYSARSKRW